MPDVPSQEILSNHGLAVWVAAIFVAGAITLIGFMFRHMAKRQDKSDDRIAGLEAFQKDTLVGLIKDSTKAHEESTAALKSLKDEFHEHLAEE